MTLAGKLTQHADLDLRLARHFVVLVEEGSFSTAARTLFLTQSALSKQVQLLERSYATCFIDRRRRPWELTSDGHEFLALCRNLLRQTVKNVVEIDSRVSCKVGVVGGDAGGWPVAKLVDAARAMPSNSRIEFALLPWCAGADPLHHNDVDILLTHVAPIGLQTEFCGTEPRLLATPNAWNAPDILTTQHAAQLPMLVNAALCPEEGAYWSLNSLQLVNTGATHLVEMLGDLAVGNGAITIPKSSAPYLNESFVKLQTLRDAPAVESFVCTRSEDKRPLVKRMSDAMKAVLLQQLAPTQPFTSHLRYEGSFH